MSSGRTPRARSGAPGRLFHPRNRHQGHYDFAALTRACPALGGFLVATPAGEPSIDFSLPAAVRMLNRALLASQYGIADWEFPTGYLCPPIPGRADYLHGLADLLAESHGGVIPRGPNVRVLDIGVGASCIYPLLGQADYGWRFTGSDIDPAALASAQKIVAANAGLAELVDLRQQTDPASIFKGIVRADERYDLSLCNPPFHASAAAAAQGSARKWQNLGKSGQRQPLRNFGGVGAELWCRGGELAFVRRMITESVELGAQVYWFSSLIANREHLRDIQRQLISAGARQVRTVAMAQGQKQSRFVAWSFLDSERAAAWRHQRWRALAPH